MRCKGRQDRKLNGVRQRRSFWFCLSNCNKPLQYDLKENRDVQDELMSSICYSARPCKRCRRTCAGHRRYGWYHHQQEIKYRCGRHGEQRDWRKNRAWSLITTSPSRNEHNKSSAKFSAKSSTPTQYAGPSANQSTTATIRNPVKSRHKWVTELKVICWQALNCRWKPAARLSLSSRWRIDRTAKYTVSGPSRGGFAWSRCE